jgi:hypothetical protein
LANSIRLILWGSAWGLAYGFRENEGETDKKWQKTLDNWNYFVFLQNEYNN